MNFPHPPGFYALVGPNAAGKTHYLLSLCGPGVAFVPAGADALFAGRTAADHIAWANEAAPRAAVDLDFPTDTPITKLSVGQRRSLTFAVALAASEPLLLLDEPFDGLDISTRTRLRHQLIDYLAADGERTVIMASHRAEDLAGLAEHAICVSEHGVGEPISLNDARSQFPRVSGPRTQVEAIVRGRRVGSLHSLGGEATAQLLEPLAPGLIADADSVSTADVTIGYPDDVALIDLIATGAHSEPK